MAAWNYDEIGGNGGERLLMICRGGVSRVMRWSPRRLPLTDAWLDIGADEMKWSAVVKAKKQAEEKRQWLKTGGAVMCGEAIPVNEAVESKIWRMINSDEELMMYWSDGVVPWNSSGMKWSDINNENTSDRKIYDVDDT